MTPPKRWTPGDPITAERLNQTVFESGIPRREVVLGNGSSLVNESLGNQTANMRTSRIRLVVAVEDFQIQSTATDLNAVIDDIPSGLVREIRLNRKTGEHAKETLSGDFRAWDPVYGLTGSFCDSASTSTSTSASDSSSGTASASMKSACDVFYVYFNEDSKRWEVLSGGSGSTVNMLHGIITRSLGCGYYEVELSEWIGETPESSSVSASASASDSSPPNECNICDELIDVNPEAAACESDQLLPEFEEIEDIDTPRIVQRQTVGTGVIVLAFDAGSRFVPLALWSDCLMVNLGDENSSLPTGSDSVGIGTERVYQIVRGHQEHLIQHRERWECCDGVDTLVGRTPIIFPGIECPEETCNVC